MTVEYALLAVAGIEVGIGAAIINQTLPWIYGNLWQTGADVILGRHTCTMTIQGGDPFCKWLRAWMAEQPYMQQTRRITVRHKNASAYPMAIDMDNDGIGETGDPVSIGIPAGRRKVIPESWSVAELWPAPGWHVFKYKGMKIWLRRECDSYQDGTYKAGDYTLRIGSKNRKDLDALIADIIEVTSPAGSKKTDIYRSSSGIWEFVESKRLRGFETVYLPSEIEIESDIKEFIASEEWYYSMGIPPRLSFLLTGDPGTGKSSAIQAIAHYTQRPLYYLNLGDKNLSDDLLFCLFARLPQRAIVAIEDIDSSFNLAENICGNSLTHSALLQCLDGGLSKDGTILCVTSNRPEMLAENLKREGRAGDKKYHFTYATAYQAAQMFQHFFQDATEAECADFGVAAEEANIGMSKIQEFLLRNRNSKLLAWSRREDISCVNND